LKKALHYYQLAVHYYRLAADQGNEKAQFNLGVCYSHGKGVEKDLKRAVHYYQLAADQGHRKAALNIKSLSSKLH